MLNAFLSPNRSINKNWNYFTLGNIESC
uniref:Uncharacterized protein n=1 Tax=Rhizophora mucronata TaxID=61149 RepID=A0A2P2PE70_RHIMU